MTHTPRLNLPYIAPAQAQKHVTLNEAFLRLDYAIQISVRSKDWTHPPEAPNLADQYLLPENAGGDWSDRSGSLARFTDGAWTFTSPKTGCLIWVEDLALALIFDGTDWVSLAPKDTQPAPMLGVNATPDAYNRFIVKTENALITHDDVTPGTGNIRLTLNKNHDFNTAALAFQSAYSGRVELGLLADNRFGIKVTDNGSHWKTALEIDGADGSVSLPSTRPFAPIGLNLYSDGGRMNGSPELRAFQVSDFQTPYYFRPQNGSSFAQGPKFIHDSSSFGGAGAALDPDIKSLIQRIRNTPSDQRYGTEFHTLTITAGTNTGGDQISLDGQSYYEVFDHMTAPLLETFSLGFHLIVKSGGVVLLQNGQADIYVEGTQQETPIPILPEDQWQQLGWHFRFNPKTYAGYQNKLHKLCAQPSSEILIALPYALPGHIQMAPNRLYGPMASREAWAEQIFA